MSNFPIDDYRKRYENAMRLEDKYRDAPRTGWTRPGSHKRENQAIQVNREEVKELARECSTQLYSSWHCFIRLHALERYMTSLAADAPNRASCGDCGLIYIPAQGADGCPFCAARREADTSTRAKFNPDSGKAVP